MPETTTVTVERDGFPCCPVCGGLALAVAPGYSVMEGLSDGWVPVRNPGGPTQTDEERAMRCAECGARWADVRPLTRTPKGLPSTLGRGSRYRGRVFRNIYGQG